MSPEKMLSYVAQIPGFYFALPWFEIHISCRRNRNYFLPHYCFLSFFLLVTAVTCCSFTKWKEVLIQELIDDESLKVYLKVLVKNAVLDHSSLKLTCFS